MELDELKSDWKNIVTGNKTKEQISLMLKENNHPVLRGIRKQLVIEVIGWALFLICYYSMFDGHQKPLMINVLLVASVLISLIHNLFGYNFARHIVDGENMLISLMNYFSKVKRFAILSVMFRIVFTAGLLSFFCYNIRFGPGKYILLVVIILGVLFQLIILGSIWIKRIKRLKQSIEVLANM